MVVRRRSFPFGMIILQGRTVKLPGGRGVIQSTPQKMNMYILIIYKKQRLPFFKSERNLPTKLTSSAYEVSCFSFFWRPLLQNFKDTWRKPRSHHMQTMSCKRRGSVFPVTPKSSTPLNSRVLKYGLFWGKPMGFHKPLNKGGVGWLAMIPLYCCFEPT